MELLLLMRPSLNWVRFSTAGRRMADSYPGRRLATISSSETGRWSLSYLDGRTHYQRNRGERPGEVPRVACLWVDEFAQTHTDCADGASFRLAHDAFVQKRCVQLSKTEVRRRAELVPLPGRAWSAMEKRERHEAFAVLALQRAWTLHQNEQNHVVDTQSGKRVSFGLIRMANIRPLFDVARAMYRLGTPVPDVRVHLCVYHSQFPLLARSEIEKQLDGVLNRRPDKQGDDPALRHASVRRLLDASPELHHMFIVLASPVCEVGRDWDSDWAIAEPSSIRSLIQLAGRVRRHRSGAVMRPNILVFDTNLRHFEHKSSVAAVFCKPGFEMSFVDPKKHDVTVSKQQDSGIHFHLKSHRLSDLLDLSEDNQTWPIDAQPRIQHADKLQPSHSLIDLEHGRMRDAMLPREPTGKFYTPVDRDATRHWHIRDVRYARIWLTGVLPQLQRFRMDSQRREDVVLLPSEDEDELVLHRVIDEQGRQQKTYTNIQDLLSQIPDHEMTGAGVGPWCHGELLELLRQSAGAQNQSMFAIAKKIGSVSLPESRDGWWFHSLLGFSKR
jgi:CRISPR-associated endonuclease/helicase Cas3